MIEEDKVMENLGIKAGHDHRAYQIESELVRYHLLLERGRAQARSAFSDREIWLITDVCNGTIFTSETITALWGEIEDACRLSGSDDRWVVDGAALVEKLKAADLLTLCALVDVIEQFWLGPLEHGGGVLQTLTELDEGALRRCAVHCFEPLDIGYVRQV